MMEDLGLYLRALLLLLWMPYAWALFVWAAPNKPNFRRRGAIVVGAYLAAFSATIVGILLT